MASDRHDVVTPIKREGTDKTYWMKVGSAWEKEEGKWSIQLDVQPMGGKLMIVPAKEYDGPKKSSPKSQDDIPF